MKFNLMVLIICVMAVVLGCNAVTKSVDYYKDCKGDSDCIAKMENARVTTSGIVANVTGTDPVNGVNNFLCEVVGLLASGLAGILYGRKVYKKRNG